MQQKKETTQIEALLLIADAVQSHEYELNRITTAIEDIRELMYMKFNNEVEKQKNKNNEL